MLFENISCTYKTINIATQPVYPLCYCFYLFICIYQFCPLLPDILNIWLIMIIYVFFKSVNMQNMCIFFMKIIPWKHTKLIRDLLGYAYICISRMYVLLRSRHACIRRFPMTCMAVLFEPCTGVLPKPLLVLPFNYLSPL